MRFHQGIEPMWVIGTIDAYGAIEHRSGNSGNSPMHTDEEKMKRCWRFNTWGQEFHAVRATDLNTEEQLLVEYYLEREGFKESEV